MKLGRIKGKGVGNLVRRFTGAECQVRRHTHTVNAREKGRERGKSLGGQCQDCATGGHGAFSAGLFEVCTVFKACVSEHYMGANVCQNGIYAIAMG